MPGLLCRATAGDSEPQSSVAVGPEMLLQVPEKDNEEVKRTAEQQATNNERQNEMIRGRQCGGDEWIRIRRRREDATGECKEDA